MNQSGYDVMDEGDFSVDIAEVSIAGKTWATNLLWFQSEGGRKDVLRDAREQADDLEVYPDFVAFRDSATPQFAYGWKQAGHRQGTRSLAAAFADAVEGSAIGVFRLSGGWWLAVVNAGLISTTGDHFFRQEEDARSAYDSITRTFSYESHFLPRGWGVEGANTTPLEDIVAGSKSARLSWLKTPGERALIAANSIRGKLDWRHYTAAGIVLASALSVAGFFAWQAHLESKEIQRIRAERAITEAQARAEREAEQRRQEAERRAKEFAYPRPWLSKPLPGDWIERCITTIEAGTNGSIYLSGWRLDKAECLVDGVNIHYSRLPLSPISELMKRGGFVINDEGSAAVKHIDYSSLKPRGDDTDSSRKAYNDEAIRFILNDRLNRIPGIRFNIALANRDRRDEKGEIVLPRRASGLQVNIPKTVIGPKEFSGFLDGLNGTEMTGLTWFPASAEWSVDFIVYRSDPSFPDPEMMTVEDFLNK